MGKLIRAKDWTQTSLGHPSGWPQHLRITLSIMLNTKFPMFLWWGEEMIQFYNDAYRPSLGNEGKHPTALGGKALDTWQEIWPVISPLIDRVKNGEATWSEDQFIPIYRNGALEDVYWTFGYSPVRDENGNVDGVLVVCHETTEKVIVQQKLEESNRRFRHTVMQAPIAMCVLRGADFVVEVANERVLQIWGKTANDMLNKPLFEGLPEARHQGIEELLNDVYNTGKNFVAHERPVNLPRNGKMETTYLDFIYEPLRELDGSISGIMAVAIEVTDQVAVRLKISEMEERWRLAIEASDLGTFDLNMETDVMVCSPRFYDIFGLPHDMHLNAYVSMVLPEDRHIRDTAYERMKETGRLTYECRINRKDGALRWIRVDGKIFNDAFEKPVRMLGTLKDVTEQRMFAQALEQMVEERTRELNSQKQFVETILDSSVDIVCVFDSELRYVAVNKTTAETYGMPKETLIGKRMTELFPQTQNGTLHKMLERAFNGEPIERFSNTSTVTGRHYDTFLVPLVQDGATHAMLAIAHDMTDVQVAAKQLEEANALLASKNKELESMNKELSSFAYVASHDLQEPLRKIHVFADRIRSKEKLSEIGIDYFARMQSAALRMQSLIEDLLTYSRTNTFDRTFETVDANALVREVIDDLSDTIRAKHATVETNGLTSLTVIPFQFRQLMSNLIGNALKFTHPERLPNVVIKGEMVKGAEAADKRLSWNKTYCKITVTDNGIGFEPAHRERIFEMFQRLHGRKEFEGTGIGLAICKKIAENHSGIITAEGIANKGAAFSVYFPLKD